MNKSRYFLYTAQDLWSNGDYTNAISRIYYAVLHSMCDVLSIRFNREIQPHHKEVRRRFVQTFPNFNELALIEMQKVRENVDYQRNYSLQLLDGDILIRHYESMIALVSQISQICSDLVG